MKLICSILMLLLPSLLFACDVTVSAGISREKLESVLNSYTTVCMPSGNYNFGSATLSIPAGKILRGASMTSTFVTSTADIAVLLASNSSIQGMKITGPAGATSTYGILIYSVTGAWTWGVEISGFLINIGINGSSGTSLLDTYVRNNGSLTNGYADPNIWISESPSTTIYYGAVFGRGNKPFGDGEISCYGSENLSIVGTQSFDSGTSSIYLVDCDDAAIQNTSIYRSGGFGIDIVGGSDRILISGNLIKDSWYAGSIFDNQLNSGGNYTGNSFLTNNLSGDNRFCSGIELFAASPLPANSSNTVTPGSLFCP